MGSDEGVDNVDVLAATASLDRGMFEAHSSLASLASEIRYLAADADLGAPAVRLAARAAIRDGHLAVIEANERIAEYADACDGGSYVLDEEELEEVAEEVEEAIEEHAEGGDPKHDDLEKALEDLRKELEDLEEKVEDMGEESEDEKEEEESDAMDAKLAARAAMRQQLVARAAKADMVTSDPMLNVHGKGEGKLDLGMKVSDDGDVVESVFEVQSKVLDVLGEKTKKAAAGIAEAVRVGTLKDSQLDALVAVAAVDAEAVKYYREYFAGADADFAKGLVAEFKKSASATEDVGFRYKRAYAVAIDAQARNLIGPGRAALDECADTLANGSDTNFDSFKRMVSSVKAPVRTAGVVPQMGVVDGGEAANTRTASDNGSVDVRDWRSLGKALFDI
jgi:Skp family chaperone for outer membrane proteins